MAARFALVKVWVLVAALGTASLGCGRGGSLAAAPPVTATIIPTTTSTTAPPATTPAPTTAPPTTVAPTTTTTAPPATYVVQAGDTLYGIASRVGVSLQALAQANALTNPSRIVPGQKLTLPPGSTPGAGG